MAIRDHFMVSDVAPLEARGRDPNKKVWVNWLPNIDLGHVLTMATFVGALIVNWNIMDRRITVIEQKLANSEVQTAEFKSDVKEIKASLGDIKSTLAVQTFINSQQYKTTPGK